MHTQDLRYGYVLARKSIYPAGTVISENVLSIFDKKRVTYVWIEDTREPIDIETVLIESGDLYVDSVIAPILKISELIPDTLQQMLCEDKCTMYHSINVAITSKYIAGLLGLPDVIITDIIVAAILHDIGKLSISKQILQKNGKLTSEEFDLVKTHVDVGCAILKQNGNFSDDIIRGVSEHHERWDGRGYNKHLSGYDIHIYARIVSISDVFDALVSKRCYKEALTREDALLVMEKDTGHFDTSILNVFIQNMRETSDYGVNILRIS